ncbi:MAG: hypothetical protein VXW04_04795 [Bacteroidota bacterium]|nr:hypothetical protein [Bacteroidota bacterium]MEC8636556.1 hypothetical protein [Bacteroidota bacterium]
MLLQIIIASGCVLISLYGLAKRNRVFFNLGYFLFGLIVVASEFSFFAESQAPIHLATAFLWLIQISLAIPNKLPYDGSKLAKSAAVKIYVCLSLINLYGIYIVRVTDVPDVAQYFHIILTVLPLVPIYLVLNDKIEITKE